MDTTIGANTLRLIEDGRRHSAFYERDLANHLPMALVALDGLGAGERQVSAFAARYERKLRPAPEPAGLVTAETASDFLGRPEAFSSWTLFFKDELARAGVRETLRLWTSRLAPGIGSFAFHGLIRTAYALESGSRGELARALASWAASYAALGELPPLSRSPVSPAEALAALDGDRRFSRRRYSGRRIADRMAQAAADPEAARIVALAGHVDIGSLAAALLGAYAATGDFTVLHGLTACHAFRGLMPFMEDVIRAERYLWQALVCAYLSAGGPAAGSPLKGDESLTWPEIRRRAAASSDEHDLKLAYSAWREWQHYGHDRYRRVAGAALAPVNGTSGR